MRKIFPLLALLLMATPVLAQTYPVRSYNLSGTITVTNTFQTVQAQNQNRASCTIQNNGTHTMYVYFGSGVSATTASSANIAAGGSVNCMTPTGNLILTDQVSITGTSGDAFYANFQ